MTFKLENERVEETVTRYHTRSPLISFVYENSGKQYIEVTISEEKSINGEFIEEKILDKIILNPEELIGKRIINPINGEYIPIGEDFVRLEASTLLSVLYTIFINASNKQRGVTNE